MGEGREVALVVCKNGPWKFLMDFLLSIVSPDINNSKIQEWIKIETLVELKKSDKLIEVQGPLNSFQPALGQPKPAV